MSASYCANAAANVFVSRRLVREAAVAFSKNESKSIEARSCRCKCSASLIDICVLRISGILKRSEFGAEERAFARHIVWPHFWAMQINLLLLNPGVLHRARTVARVRK